MTAIVGIDPGITGALALFKAGRLVDLEDMPVHDGRADGSWVGHYLLDWDPEVVYLEWAHPMPKNGSIASFSLGLNSGIVIGVVQSLGFPLERVRPAVWKVAMGLRGKPKAASRGMATELFPDFADQFRRVKDDGRAEAALIARYGAYVNIRTAVTGRDDNGEMASVSELRGRVDVTRQRMGCMMDLDEFDDHPAATDFRRSNGAPMVRSLDGKKWERYSRPSSWGKDLDEQSALVNWKLLRAVEGVACTPSLAADIAAHVGQKEGSNDRVQKAIELGKGEEAADLGTALHAMAHRLETDPGFKAPEPHASDLAAYLGAIDSAGLESTHCEVHLCSDVWRAAGTADRIYRTKRELALPDGTKVPPGTSFIGDLKTGKRLDYAMPGYGIQMAVYADGCFYDVETDERSPLPDGLHTGWGILVHLPAGQATATLLWADLEIGRAGARIVQAVRAWRKRDDFAHPFIFPTSDEVAVLTSGVYDLEHPILDETEVAEFGEWSEAMTVWAQARINQIGLLPEPRALLLRRWPSEVPTLRQGGLTPLQLASVLDLLDKIEAAFSLPFPEGDPRVAWNEGRRKGDNVRGNQPVQGIQGARES